VAFQLLSQLACCFGFVVATADGLWRSGSGQVRVVDEDTGAELPRVRGTHQRLLALQERGQPHTITAATTKPNGQLLVWVPVNTILDGISNPTSSRYFLLTTPFSTCFDVRHCPGNAAPSCAGERASLFFYDRCDSNQRFRNCG